MMRWWVDRGVDGFRMDVINLISKPEELTSGGPIEPGQSSLRRVANGPRLDEFLAEMNREVGLDAQNLLTVGEMPGATIEVAGERSPSSPARAQHGVHLRTRQPRPGLVEQVGPGRPAAPPPEGESGAVAGRPGRGRLELAVLRQPRPAPGRLPVRRRLARTSGRLGKTLATVLHLHKGTPYIYQGEEVHDQQRHSPRSSSTSTSNRSTTTAWRARPASPSRSCAHWPGRAATTPAPRCSGTPHPTPASPPGSPGWRSTPTTARSTPTRPAVTRIRCSPTSSS